eukprot:3542064-Rhodomonas_salina.1
MTTPRSEAPAPNLNSRKDDGERTNAPPLEEEEEDGEEEEGDALFVLTVGTVPHRHTIRQNRTSHTVRVGRTVKVSVAVMNGRLVEIYWDGPCSFVSADDFARLSLSGKYAMGYPEDSNSYKVAAAVSLRRRKQRIISEEASLAAAGSRQHVGIGVHLRGCSRSCAELSSISTTTMVPGSAHFVFDKMRPLVGTALAASTLGENCSAHDV